MNNEFLTTALEWINQNRDALIWASALGIGWLGLAGLICGVVCTKSSDFSKQEGTINK